MCMYIQVAELQRCMSHMDRSRISESVFSCVQLHVKPRADLELVAEIVSFFLRQNRDSASTHPQTER